MCSQEAAVRPPTLPPVGFFPTVLLSSPLPLGSSSLQSYCPPICHWESSPQSWLMAELQWAVKGKEGLSGVKHGGGVEVGLGFQPFPSRGRHLWELGVACRWRPRAPTTFSTGLGALCTRRLPQSYKHLPHEHWGGEGKSRSSSGIVVGEGGIPKNPGAGVGGG